MGFTAAAMLPKQARGTLGKHITKPSEQVAAPPSTLPTLIADCTIRNKVNESHYRRAESFGPSFRRIPLSEMLYFAQIDSIVSYF